MNELKRQMFMIRQQNKMQIWKGKNKIEDYKCP